MPRVSRKQRAEAASRRERAYLAWLMASRGLDMQRAIAYATRGEAGLAALAAQERPRTKREIETAREADRPEDVRRWSRLDRPCPFRGCIYPANHSGPHRVVRDLDKMQEDAAEAANGLAEMDRRSGDVLGQSRQLD